MTLWAGSSAPRRLAQARTDAGDISPSIGRCARFGRLALSTAKGGHSGADKTEGENPALALLPSSGSQPPSRVTINEMTTVASVWTHAQFIDGDAIKGHALGLRIAAGNVPNFVDLETGGWGRAHPGPLNSGQTPTMANFATLADLFAGCATRVSPLRASQALRERDAAQREAPTDTLTAAQSIARIPGANPNNSLHCSICFIRFRKARTCGRFRSCPI